MPRMRALAVVTALLLSCQSGVTVDPGGSLQFPCTRDEPSDPTKSNCPGDLFCGADGRCHSYDAGGSYACRADGDCGGGFRCGPSGSCVDPAADALRTDAADVKMRFQRAIPSEPSWGNVTALAAGGTHYNLNPQGRYIDYTPFAFSDQTSVYSVAFSHEGFYGSPTLPLQRVFAGRAPIAGASQLAVAQDFVAVVTGTGQRYTYQWQARPSDPPLAPINPGPPDASVGSVLRSGNSAAPYIIEFTPDQNTYVTFDPALQTFEPPINAGQPINDVIDTGGRYIFAILNGVLHGAVRRNGPPWDFRIVGLNSPGRNELLSCGATGITGRLIFHSVHVADNPDLDEVEHPLVAVQYREVLDAGVTGPRSWMRIDPEPTLGSCGQVPTHIARGTCPVCGAGETPVDMQWGIDPITQEPGLRAECIGASGTVFYDLNTDSTGFACFRTRRPPTVGYRVGPDAGPDVRSTSHVRVQAVAIGKRIQFRRDGFESWVGLTMDQAPIVAQSTDAGLVAFGVQTIYRESGPLGMVLSQHIERGQAYPTWISGDLVFFSDGRVGPASDLLEPASSARPIAIPMRSDLELPIAGTSARGTDGHRYVLMSAYDALLGTDLTAPAPPGPRALEVRAVPEAQVQILSLAVLETPPADAGVLFRGFVLTENRVFQLDAVTPQQWSVSEVTVPPGRWTEVWADRDRGRVGYANGRVYALPSGVLLAPELPGGVTDFQQHCGRTWALNARGLYRLDVAAGSGAGEWKAQGEPDGGGAPYDRMYGGPNGELWVFGRDGNATLLKGDPCTP